MSQNVERLVHRIAAWAWLWELSADDRRLHLFLLLREAVPLANPRRAPFNPAEPSAVPGDRASDISPWN